VPKNWWQSRSVGRRENVLVGILVASGLRIAIPPTRRPIGDLPSSKRGILRQLFVGFGGVEGTLSSCVPGGWDMAFDGGLVVELDEEQHFNRYRLESLELTPSGERPWADAYVDFSRGREVDCMKKAGRGGYWTNTSAERLFGLADPPGVFGAHGSPRWKQRALYDTAKDLTPGVRLARIAAHDRIGNRTVAEVLDSEEVDMFAKVRTLIESRASET
jgi:hypothetical protein